MTEVIILLRFPHSKLFEDHGFDKKHEMSRNVGNYQSDHLLRFPHSKLSEDHGFDKKHEMPSNVRKYKSYRFTEVSPY